MSLESNTEIEQQREAWRAQESESRIEAETLELLGSITDTALELFANKRLGQIVTADTAPDGSPRVRAFTPDEDDGSMYFDNDVMSGVTLIDGVQLVLEELYPYRQYIQAYVTVIDLTDVKVFASEFTPDADFDDTALNSNEDLRGYESIKALRHAKAVLARYSNETSTDINSQLPGLRMPYEFSTEQLR